MITRHIRLTCDDPRCEATIFSAPLDFLSASEVEKRLVATALSAGWFQSPPSGRRPARIYCPSHAPRGLYRTIPAESGEDSGQTA